MPNTTRTTTGTSNRRTASDTKSTDQKQTSADTARHTGADAATTSPGTDRPKNQNALPDVDVDGAMKRKEERDREANSKIKDQQEADLKARAERAVTDNIEPGKMPNL